MNFIKAVLIITILIQCNSAKENEFQKYLKLNVTKCARIFIQNKTLDSITANNYCSCLLTKLYEVDSTIVNKKGKELTEMINKFKDKINKDCDSIISQNHLINNK